MIRLHGGGHFTPEGAFEFHSRQNGFAGKIHRLVQGKEENEGGGGIFAAQRRQIGAGDEQKKTSRGKPDRTEPLGRASQW
jgi:hypothetical protein